MKNVIVTDDNGIFCKLKWNKKIEVNKNRIKRVIDMTLYFNITQLIIYN